MGVAKGASTDATLAAVAAELGFAKARDALRAVRRLAVAAKARDAKPGRPTFELTPEPVKAGDAAPSTPTTDAGAKALDGRM